jgi:hypothetical protein
LDQDLALGSGLRELLAKPRHLEPQVVDLGTQGFRFAGPLAEVGFPLHQ